MAPRLFVTAMLPAVRERSESVILGAHASSVLPRSYAAGSTGRLAFSGMGTPPLQRLRRPVAIEIHLTVAER